MKKSLFVAAIAALAVVACKKSETTDAAATADSTVVAADSTAVDSTAADSTTVAADSTAVAADSTATKK